jgi:4-hydroxy-tetrahydrodipicolinate reductase
MKKTRILWSGITGRTGAQAVIAAKNCDHTEIVVGICRNNEKFYSYDDLGKIGEPFDVIVDFSHKDSFDKILSFALKVKKPLAIGTSGLSEHQKAAIEKAAQTIPIFFDSNFRFAVKEFTDKVVELARESTEEIILKETFYKTKREIPSGTAKTIAKKVRDETGKDIQIQTSLEYDGLMWDWEVSDMRCHGGFEALAIDVLRISEIMASKRPTGVYNLDRLIDEAS